MLFLLNVWRELQEGGRLLKRAYSTQTYTLLPSFIAYTLHIEFTKADA
jgi:hypothetical protein